MQLSHVTVQSSESSTDSFTAPADTAGDVTTNPATASTVSRNSAREAIYDAELVRRFNAGDAAAFDEIISRYRERIFLVALAFLRNRADAEEIAQDTFVRAYRSLARFRGDSSLATWLHRIAINLARNRYWYFFRRQRHTTLSFDCALNDTTGATWSEMFASDAPSPAREVVTGEFSSLVSSCMEKLGESHREILTLRAVLNQSYQQIGAALGISVGTVKSRIARARTCLRKLLAEACPEFAADAMQSDWFEPTRPAGRFELTPA